MSEAWQRLGIVRKVIISGLWVFMAVGVARFAVTGEWAMAVRALFGVLIVAWTFGPIGALRQQTTGRLSAAQALAVVLCGAVGYGAWRLFTDRGGITFSAVIIAVGVVMLARTIASQGWSRQSE